MTKLEQIFYAFNIRLKDGDKDRHIADVLEDLFLKINISEYQKLIDVIAKTEQQEGHIFDQFRNRPYQ
jgi:hypothetical protein